MSLQGPLILISERPAPDLATALSAAGAFPAVEVGWTEAPSAFAEVKPTAVVVTDPGPPTDGAAARALSACIAETGGPMVAVVACVDGEQEAALPIALPSDASLPATRLVERLQTALRVRALHATVLRRFEMFDTTRGKLPDLPAGDALDDATVLIAGRGRLYPALSVAMGERVTTVGALSVEAAARHLGARDLDGIVICDGFSPRMVEAFLTVLAQDSRFHHIPVAVTGLPSGEFAAQLPSVDHITGAPARLVARMLPRVRLHAFERLLKRVLASLESGGRFDAVTGLLTRDAFWQELARAMEEASDQSQALSLARVDFDRPLEARAIVAAARLLGRLTRSIDFATGDLDGDMLIAFTQTDLRSAHVIARRIAGVLKNTVLAPHGVHAKVAANVTLATLKAGDTLDSLMLRVMGGRAVAAE